MDLLTLFLLWDQHVHGKPAGPRFWFMFTSMITLVLGVAAFVAIVHSSMPVKPLATPAERCRAYQGNGQSPLFLACVRGGNNQP